MAAAAGVNLIRNPEYKQYTPDEDPYFKMFGKARSADPAPGETRRGAAGHPGAADRHGRIGGRASILYQFGTNGAFLLLSALGLIVILGMMNIINLAHGELMMMGAYTATAHRPARRAVPARRDRRLRRRSASSAPCSSG